MSRSLLSLFAAIGLTLAVIPVSVGYAQADEYDDTWDDIDPPVAAPRAAPAPATRPAPTAAPTPATTAAPTAQAQVTLTHETADASLDAEGADVAGSASATPTETRRSQLFRMQNTWKGATGGVHIVDAFNAPAETFRLQLGMDFFVSNGFLQPGDDNKYVGGSLAFSWSLIDELELFAAIESHANYNSQEDPKLFQVLGDTTLGVKGYYPVLPWLALGGDFRLGLLNTVGDIGLVLASTSFGLRGNVTADLRALESPVPFIARFNLDYYFNNSSALIEDVEQQRYQNLMNPNPDPSLEDRNLVTSVERFGLGIDRTDSLTFGLGFEAPLEVSTDFFLQPLIEWQLSVPINRQGYNCLFIPSTPGGSDPVSGQDGCLDVQGFSAFPHTFTFGVRVLPPVKGLSALLAVDVGAGGTSTPVRELAANKPFDVIFALAYAYDTRDPLPVIVEAPAAEPEPEPEPIVGRIQGVVVEQGAGIAVAGAGIGYDGTELTMQQASSEGRFVSYEFAPGARALSISHPEYENGTCNTTIPEAGGDVQLRCELVAKPRRGTVTGRITDADGKAVARASVQITGPSTQTLTSQPSGIFDAADMAPGSYTVRVDADGYLIKTETFAVVANQTTALAITLVAKPKNALVSVTRSEIRIKKAIFFVTGSAEIEARSNDLMTEIADVMLRNPQVQLVEIQGHTDNVGAADYNRQLSQERADSVRNWLINAGVEPARMEAKGYGPDRPLVPNLTPGNRARNRRVQFMIREQAATP